MRLAQLEGGKPTLQPGHRTCNIPLDDSSTYGPILATVRAHFRDESLALANRHGYVIEEAAVTNSELTDSRCYTIAAASMLDVSLLRMRFNKY